MIDSRSVGFGARAREYESARPSYPAAALDRATDALGLEPSSTVVDVAAGTGKLTRLLAERFGEVIAVEPSAGMRAVLEDVVPTATARAGSAEETGLADASADGVFVGEAFHWFDEPATIREFARVLRPGCGFALMWNLERWSGEENPWLHRFGEIVGPLRDHDFPGQRGDWTPSATVEGLFTAPEKAGFSHTHDLDADGFVAMVSSWSWIASLDEDRREQTLAAVRQVLADDGVEAVSLDYETVVITARKAPPGP